MRQAFLLLAILILSAPSAASPSDRETTHGDHASTHEWGFDIGLGLAGIDNPLNQRDNLVSVVLPQWYYYAERFYIETTDIGYALIEQPSLLIDIAGYVNQDGILFNTDNHPVSYLEISKLIPNVGGRPDTGQIDFPDIERDFSYMLGLKAMYLNDWFELTAQWGRDVFQGHGGEEFTFSLQKSYRFGDWKFNWELGTVAKNDAVNNYYFGIRAEENGLRKDTQVTDKWLWDNYLKVAVVYRLSESMSAVTSLHYTRKPSALTMSPILEKQQYWAGFVGLNYHF